MRKWLLPEYVEDILPPEARRVEVLRARLLELFRVHGYRLVVPPMLEYLESLLTGTGHDLDLRTFKLVDQFSGRMMGLRADITPQVARIDAHLLNQEGVTRLCYAGSVLHASPRGLNGTREPLQIGAEIYGHAGIESDLEIQRLLVEALAACGIADAALDIGHVGVFRALCRRGAVDAELEAELHEALEAKDLPRLEALTGTLEEPTRAALLLLPQLYGDASLLARARAALPAYPEIEGALEDLARLAQDIAGVPVSIDLADLRGYHYHSGVVFSAYVGQLPNAVALGGRYDEVGKAFGRARPATGFSIDLRDLARVLPPAPDPGGIRAPYGADPDLAAAIRKLREAGEVVVVDLPGHGAQGAAGCDRELSRIQGAWQVRKL
ncbi:MAG: ATP phosphoribosyltransferase regulatory subunit [Betaproteobacteria bacterium]|nr:ATP phosphoribosyltransferase regulatory subunit [Betaproteobacteria bacterium]